MTGGTSGLAAVDSAAAVGGINLTEREVGSANVNGEPRSGRDTQAQAQLAWISHRMDMLLERADDRRELGRALVEERARSLQLERQLFDAAQRAQAAERRLGELKEPRNKGGDDVEPALASELGSNALKALRAHVSEAEAAARSLLNSRVLRIAGLASAAPSGTAARIVRALKHAREILGAVEPGEGSGD